MGNQINIYFHIGETKTGSSIIQNFLDVNRHNLYEDFGFLYPNIKSETLEAGRFHNHQTLFHSETMSIYETILSHIEYAKNKKIKNIIYSSENIFQDLFNRPEIDYKSIFQNLSQNDQISITAILFFRRIDNWVESAWKQWGIKQFDSIEKYYEKYCHPWHVENVLKKFDIIKNCFGNNFIIIPYEKSQLPEGVLPDFLKHLNLEYKGIDWKKPERKNFTINRGFSKEVMEAFQLSRKVFKDHQNSSMASMFFNLLGEDFLKQPFESYSLLTKSQREKIIELYSPSYLIIAKNFLSRKDGVLFYEGIPEYDENNYEFTLKEFVPIIVKMVYEQQQTIMQLNDRIKVLEKSK